MDKLRQLPRPLCAKYESDFAYPTVKDRMPVILTKVVDTVYRMRNEHFLKTYGEEGVEDLKTIVGLLSKLKNEIQTDKPLLNIDDNADDATLWNTFIECDRKSHLSDGGREPPSWFKSSWLYVECYFYRRIFSAFALSHRLKAVDPFREQKQHALIESQSAITSLAQYLEKNSSTSGKLDEIFHVLFQVALWGNKCDLSISLGADNSQKTNPVLQVDSFKPFILSDNTTHVLKHLFGLRQRTSATKKSRLDIVLDNSGFELLTDIVLADFLSSRKIVDVIHFHGKSLPWFVSDVTEDDWSWTLDKLVSSRDDAVVKLGRRWKERMVDGSWVFKTNPFWTLPYDFASMALVAPDLHDDLSRADLIIFKGDLNYRKLTGDLKWDSTVSFSYALRGFHPAPLCSLRTLKCDLVVGLSPGQAEKAESKDKDWMLSGSYAVIQFAS